MRHALSPTVAPVAPARASGTALVPRAPLRAAPLAARRALQGAAAALPPITGARLARAARRRDASVARASFVDGIADARIKVIGCGGGGGNAVNRMIMAGLQACVLLVL